ncbi:envelope-like protein [Cucumis melo var. makuwa]|uniref:Envelope-like protein n=2 Tax=Cucumis melo TaxID=3656 RepID=A0A5A7UC98_CUCMM|nr:envelope-like protein [Cucumis melo var. makuwa]TYK00682.1 envelope-like protein [Cucumis melo var. makuwa]
MVNTRKGNYATKSSEKVHEALVSQSIMHGVRMRGRHFTKEIGIGSAAKDAENAPSAYETHISEMDFDDLDNVPLARLLKKSSVFYVTTKKSNDPILSVHSQESSSSKGVFVLTPGLHYASNVEPGPSHHSSPVRSSILDNVTTSNPHFNPAPALADKSIATEGRTSVPR